MRRPPTLRWRARATALLAALIGLSTSAGCIHNHYYGNAAPFCSTGTGGGEITTIPYGAVCEVPARVEGGTIVAQSPPASPSPAPSPAPVVIGQNPPQSRILVSQPRMAASRPWRRTDPEGGLATTRVEGGLDESLSR